MGGRWLGVVLAAGALTACGAEESRRGRVPSASQPRSEWGAVIERQVGDIRVEMRSPPEEKWSSIPHRIVGIGSDGAELWTIEQPDWHFPFSEPVVADGRLVFSVRADLLEVDVGQGRIVRRSRFPGTIRQLAVAEDLPAAPAVLRVTVDSEGMMWSGPALDATIRYRLGDVPPGRGGWSMLAPGEPERRVKPLLPEGGADAGAPALEAALDRLRSAEQRDATNPFYAFHRARALELLGRDDAAAAAYRQAAAFPAAVWSDLLRLSWQLEARGRRDAAALAFERGHERMLEARVRPERLQSLVMHNVLLGRDGRQSITAAIASGDPDRVHELETRRWRVFPKLEYGQVAWRALADWMAEQGRGELAAIWRERAAAAEDGYLNRLEGRARWIQVTTLPFVFGLLLALPVIAFALGMRFRTRPLTWKTHAQTLATLVAPVLVSFLLAAVGVAWFYNFDDPWMDDSFASGAALETLEARPPSDARDEVLAFARAEAAAMADGGWHEGPMPDDATIAEAFTPLPRWSSRFRRADKVIADDTPWARVVPLSWSDTPWAYAFALLIPFALGLLVYRFVPRASRVITASIPGGPAQFSVTGGLVLGAFVAGLLALLDYYGGSWEPEVVARVKVMFEVPSVTKMIGYQDIWDGSFSGPSLAWAYLCVIGIPVAQGLLLWRHRRRA